MAKDLTKTCYQMYAKQGTGLSPEIAYFNTDANVNAETLTVRVGLIFTSFVFPKILLLQRIMTLKTYYVQN